MKGKHHQLIVNWQKYPQWHVNVSSSFKLPIMQYKSKQKGSRATIHPIFLMSVWLLVRHIWGNCFFNDSPLTVLVTAEDEEIPWVKRLEAAKDETSPACLFKRGWNQTLEIKTKPNQAETKWMTQKKEYVMKKKEAEWFK